MTTSFNVENMVQVTVTLQISNCVISQLIIF